MTIARPSRSLALAAFLAILAAMLVAPARSARSLPLYPFDAATRATGVTTTCASSWPDWRRLVAASGWGDIDPNSARAVFYYSIAVVGNAAPMTLVYYPPDVCNSLIHWRRASSDDVWGALWLVATYWAESDQFKAGLGLDDAWAEYIGCKRVPTLRRALGIHRRLAAPFPCRDLRP